MYRTAALAAALLLVAPQVRAETPVVAPGNLVAAVATRAADFPEASAAAIDRAAEDALRRTGVPSASIAVVRDGRIAYVRAYGARRLDPVVPADTRARYGIGSVTKQFTATAILMLAEEGLLSLDDPVGKYIDGLTEGQTITIRQVLSHTSGYRDYWPQDYVMDEMMRAASPQHILDKWARVPLDYRPGAEWQYSNTGYTIAGLIIEKVSGQAYMEFMRTRLFKPLGMTGVTETDTRPLEASDARGYMRYALGPLRPAPQAGEGWLFAMASLAMPAEDLARWDLGQIHRTLLQRSSYEQQFTTVKLADGRDSGYGLGVFLGRDHGRTMISHGGAISGYLAENRVYPDDKAAIVVLINADFGSAQGAIADRIADVLFPGDDQTRVARAIFDELRAGRIDRSRFTANGNAYFSDQAVADFKSSLGPLGDPTGFAFVRKVLRGGMTSEVYRVTYADRVLRIALRAYPDGKVEEFMVSPVE